MRPASRLVQPSPLAHSPPPQVLDAMLTGESVPISKNLVPVKEASGLGDRKCMAFSATTVSAGQGLGVVCATGNNRVRYRG